MVILNCTEQLDIIENYLKEHPNVILEIDIPLTGKFLYAMDNHIALDTLHYPSYYPCTDGDRLYVGRAGIFVVKDYNNDITGRAVRLSLLYDIYSRLDVR